jgi:hypothetical protein
MNKEKFLTVRWNNILTLALGLPALIFIVYAYSSGFWMTRGGLIGLSLVGVVY